MNQNLSIPATLRPSRTKLVLMFLGSAVFVVCGVLMVRDGKMAGYFCGGFFGLCLLIFAAQLHPKATYLHLTEDGFTCSILFRTHSYRWASIQKFGVTVIGTKRMVGWNFTPGHQTTERKRNLSQASKALCGYEAALPDTYGLKPEELADLLNRFLLKYSQTSHVNMGSNENPT